MVKTISIVSLSSGMLGEDFFAQQLGIGIGRLEKYGLKVKFTPNALKGIGYIAEHPEKRAEDLITAYRDDETDMILCAIGGDDTYRLLPYLFDNDELKNAVSDKIFLGFSDTTINHFMLYKVGARSFYGQSFVSDICELDNEMLPYTRRYFEELISTGTISEVTPSDVWYESRETNGGFGTERIGTQVPSHTGRGFELLQGSGKFSGKILGGCIDSIYDMFDGGRYADMPVLCKKYGLFPPADEWRGKILLLESSEEKPSPEKYGKTLSILKDMGIFDVISGVITGKPMDETYHDEYKEQLRSIIADPKLPVLCDVNIGHCTPRCVIPFGAAAHVDAAAQKITFDN